MILLNHWVWALGICFIAGVTLYLFSLRQSKDSDAAPSSQAATDVDEKRRVDHRLSLFPASAGECYARLNVQNGLLAGESFQLCGVLFSVGALPGNDLIVPGDAALSAQHFQFYCQQSVLMIEDNHSTNGTFLNGAKLSAGRHIVRPGDTIDAGQTQLVIERA